MITAQHLERGDVPLPKVSWCEEAAGTQVPDTRRGVQLQSHAPHFEPPNGQGYH